MKDITFISDTHGLHNYLTNDLQGGYMIIHSGDISNYGSFNQINDFLNWYTTLPYTHKIFIAGNHDFGFESIRHNDEPGIVIPDNIIYLQDSSVIIDDIKIYGSPWQPRFHNWAFNVDRGDAIAEKWKLIPKDADIVIAHGPVYGILDDVPNGLRVGCEELYKRIIEVQPKIFVSGHIHYGYGIRDFNCTTFINAASLSESYRYTNKPIVIDYDEL
jgi:predicted phosphodiesterase